MLKLADVFEALTNIRPPLAETVITEAAVDSRQVIPGSMFVAIPGERVDGHDFVADAFQRGASLALIEHELPGSFQTVRIDQGQSLNSSNELDSPLCLHVENTVSALQKVARFWRRKLDLRVIGITGSVGKSTTKEVIAEVLSQRYRTLKSPGNMNNEIGLPLTILKLGIGYERAVLE
jgi:UDP-N-acetylmuramoyl-tripeptide--D-alanyl-D-alanine ligase